MSHSARFVTAPARRTVPPPDPSFSRAGGPADEEIVPAVFRRDELRGEGPLAAWVWRIVVNEARRLARRPREEPLQMAPEPGRNGQGGDPMGVRAWVATLPERQREAVFLRYYADLDYRTIADVLEIQIGTVAATLSAAHQTLRKRLEATR